MRKDRRKRAQRKGKQATKTGKQGRQLSLVKVLVDTKEALRELVLHAGLEVFQALLEEERSELCGERYKAAPERNAYRHGSVPGEVVLGGRKITTARPRVRSIEGKELGLPTWEAMKAEDPLTERVLEQMLVGVSTRKYERSLEPVDPSLHSHSTSRSSVSRRFKARTAAQVDEFLSRSLEGLDLPVVMIDGKHFWDHVLLIAMGIDSDGQKHPLGVVEGTTETEAVCRNLLDSLVARGLQVERARLFVIDGAKGLRRAIRTVFGQWALVQRCQIHKERNILDHLPKKLRDWARSAIRKAYKAESRQAARRRLLELAKQFEDKHPGAAASIREGLAETLTVIELGLTLRSTNIIENVIGTLDRVARNVKRWRGGEMAQRWAVTGLLEASSRFRRISGHQHMPALLRALEAKVQKLDACSNVA